MVWYGTLPLSLFLTTACLVVGGACPSSADSPDGDVSRGAPGPGPARCRGIWSP